MANNLKTEFSEKEEAIAKLVAFITDSSVIFDEGEKAYIIISDEEINEKYKDAMKKGNVLLAKKILDGAQRNVSIDIRKESREIVSKSVRISGIKYLQLLSESFKNDTSISDTIRARICNLLQNGFGSIESVKGVKTEKLNLIKKAIDNWKKEKSTKPKSDYSKSDEFSDVECRDALMNAQKIKLKLYLEKEKIPQDIIDIIVEDIDTDVDIFDYTLTVKKSERNDYSLRIYLTLEQPMPSSDPSSMRKIIETINNMFPYDADYMVYNNDNTLLKSEFFIDIKENQVILEGIPLKEENEDKVKSLILSKILPGQFKDFDPEKANKQAVGCINKNMKKAKELTDDIVIYKDFEKTADWLTDSLFEDIGSSEVVTFSIPKLILHLFEIVGGEL